MSGPVGRHEDPGSYRDVVKSTIGIDYLVEHGLDTGAIGDVARDPNGISAPGDPGSRYADPLSDFGNEFFSSVLGSFQIEIGANDMRALIDHGMRHFPANTTPGTDDNHDLARKFTFGWHALKLRFFERPVFDIEGLFLRQPDVFIDGLGSTHYRDGAIVKLSSHA